MSRGQGASRLRKAVRGAGGSTWKSGTLVLAKFRSRSMFCSGLYKSRLSFDGLPPVFSTEYIASAWPHGHLHRAPWHGEETLQLWLPTNVPPLGLNTRSPGSYEY